MSRYNIVIKDAELLFRNFAGRETQFSPAGKRSFNVKLPEDQVDPKALLEEGWNIRFRPSYDGSEEYEYAHMSVEVSYKVAPPTITLITRRGKVMLNEEELSRLDWADLSKVYLSINPYRWTVGKKTGIKAYLKEMVCVLVEDDYLAQFDDIPMISD